jgi:hypothetical protein
MPIRPWLAGLLAALAVAAACASSAAAAPGPPRGLAVSSPTPTSLVVRWLAPQPGGAAAYAVRRNGIPAGTTARRSRTLTALTCGVRYTVTVAALDGGGRRSRPVTASGLTRACPNRPASVFVAPGAPNGAPCTQAAPCGSFDRAYHVARPGQTVEIAAGSYPGQQLTRDASKRSHADVVVRPAAGAKVTIHSLDVVGAAHVEVRDLAVPDGWQVLPGSSDVTLRNLESNAAYVVSASDVNVLGGSAGPQTDYDTGQIKPDCLVGCPPSLRILFDGVHFHDAVLSPGSNAHVECLQIWGSRYVTIRNSRFVNCDSHNVFVGGEGERVRDITFENNMGGEVPSGYHSFRIAAAADDEGCTNIVYRYNSATTAMLVECGRSASGVRLVGNLGPYDQQNCERNLVFSHNVWDGAKCGATDVNAPSGFRDARRNDLRLAAGSAAIDRGDPRDYPAVDIDGTRRPAGRAPDAGAHELS